MLRGLADKVGMNVIVGCVRIDLKIKPPRKLQDVGLRQAGADDRTSKVAGNLPDRPTSRAIGRIQLVTASTRAFAFVHVCICHSSPQLQYAEPLRLKIQSQGDPTSALHTMTINKLAGSILILRYSSRPSASLDLLHPAHILDGVGFHGRLERFSLLGGFVRSDVYLSYRRL